MCTVLSLVLSCRVVTKFHYTNLQTFRDPTRPTDKIRTYRYWPDRSTTRQSPRTCQRPERTRSDFVRNRVVDPGLRQSPVGSL